MLLVEKDCAEGFHPGDLNVCSNEKSKKHLRDCGHLFFLMLYDVLGNKQLKWQVVLGFLFRCFISYFIIDEDAISASAVQEMKLMDGSDIFCFQLGYAPCLLQDEPIFIPNQQILVGT